MVSHWSLRDSIYPQVSRTLFSILADLNNTLIGMVSTRFPISKSSNRCVNLVIAPSVLITIGITVIFMFHCFFRSLSRSRYLSFLFLTLIWGPPGQQSLQFATFSLFLFMTLSRSCRLAKIR